MKPHFSLFVIYLLLYCLRTDLRSSRICRRCVMPAQKLNVTTVVTITQTQYRTNLSGASHPSDGIENSVARNVAGKNAMVNTAIVFMDEPSWRVASASSLLAVATSTLMLESSWVRNANNYGYVYISQIQRALKCFGLLLMTGYASGIRDIRTGSSHFYTRAVAVQ